jgi:hypothetical protein
MALDTIDLSGRVERRLLNPGSKSEQHGLVLVADDARVWTLRRVGGPVFGDAELAALEGRRIQATARVRDQLLLLERWTLLA